MGPVCGSSADRLPASLPRASVRVWAEQKAWRERAQMAPLRTVVLPAQRARLLGGSHLSVRSLTPTRRRPVGHAPPWGLLREMWEGGDARGWRRSRSRATSPIATDKDFAEGAARSSANPSRHRLTVTDPGQTTRGRATGRRRRAGRAWVCRPRRGDRDCRCAARRRGPAARLCAYARNRCTAARR